MSEPEKGTKRRGPGAVEIIVGIAAVVVVVLLMVVVGTYRSDAENLRSERDGLQAQLDQARALNQSLQNRLDTAGVVLQRANSQVISLKRRYNGLLSDFQRTINTFRLYVTSLGYSSPTYTPSYDYISCTSSSIGSYVYTDCYG